MDKTNQNVPVYCTTNFLYQIWPQYFFLKRIPHLNLKNSLLINLPIEPNHLHEQTVFELKAYLDLIFDIFEENIFQKVVEEVDVDVEDEEEQEEDPAELDALFMARLNVSPRLTGRLIAWVMKALALTWRWRLDDRGQWLARQWQQC